MRNLILKYLRIKPLSAFRIAEVVTKEIDALRHEADLQTARLIVSETKYLFRVIRENSNRIKLLEERIFKLEQANNAIQPPQPDISLIRHRRGKDGRFERS